MRKQRIIALILSILLTISVSFSRIMPVYADTTLTAGAIDVLYGLLGSGGVIFAHEGTDVAKRQAIADWWTSAPDMDKYAFKQGLEAITVDADGNYHLTNSDGFTYDKDWFYSLYQSAVDYFDSSFHLTFPEGYTSITNSDFVSDVYFSYSCSDTPVFVTQSAGGTSSVYGVLPTGYSFYYTVSSDGVVTYDSDKHGKFVGTDSFLKFSVKAWGSSYTRFSFSLVDSTGKNVLSGVSGSSAGIIYGGINDLYGIVGGVVPSTSSLSVIGGLNVDGTIDADSWSQTMSDTVADTNKDVVILGGQDLANYDTADDVRNGIITGVDWTGSTNPDIPVDDGTILGKLDSLIKWLAGLPALIGTAVGNTVIGSGSLDFSKFKNIDLSTVFPFCVPFDLINSFKGFNSVAVEPKWVVDFDQTAMKAGQVELDLTQFDSIFSIVRYFIYAGFVVSLILATRSLVKG